MRFLSKGSKVVIEGKLRWSQWERDGQKRSKLEVIVDEIEFMSSRNGGGDGDAYGNSFGNGGYSNGFSAAPSNAGMSAPRQAAPVVDASVYDEDIPF